MDYIEPDALSMGNNGKVPTEKPPPKANSKHPPLSLTHGGFLFLLFKHKQACQSQISVRIFTLRIVIGVMVYRLRLQWPLHRDNPHIGPVRHVLELCIVGIGPSAVEAQPPPHPLIHRRNAEIGHIDVRVQAAVPLFLV